MPRSNIYELIGKKIRELRTAQLGRSISQEDLAKAIGTTTNTISRWETATYKPSVQDLESIARFFGVPIAVFFPGMPPDAKVQALLSATGDLADEDLEELTRYAQFRKARRSLKETK